MRVFSLIVVGLSLVILTLVLLHNRRSEDDAGLPYCPTDVIRVTGPGNTLTSLAARFGRPGVFEYDAKSRTATSHASLIIEGELILGREDDPASGETLEFDTRVCGDLRLEVPPTGKLCLFHSATRTVSQVLSPGACLRGYALFVDGELVMKDSRVTYLSGSTSQCLRGAAKATIVRSVFSHCDGSALNCIDVDGARIHIESCYFSGSGNWGLVVQGRAGETLEIRDSGLDGRVGGLFITGQSASVRLVDCVFDPAKLVFGQDSGEVTIAWTRRIKVVDARTQAPLAGVWVCAENQAGGDSPTPPEAQTNAEGLAELLLVERIARPGSAGPPREPARYRLRLRGPAGKLRAEREGLTVAGKDLQPLIVPAS